LAEIFISIDLARDLIIIKMKYKKRSYGKKKKQFKSIVPIPRSSISNYDGISYRKIVADVPVLFNAARSHGDVTVVWCGAATTGDNNYCRLADQTEFTVFAAIHREYRV